MDWTWSDDYSYPPPTTQEVALQPQWLHSNEFENDISQAYRTYNNGAPPYKASQSSTAMMADFGVEPSQNFPTPSPNQLQPPYTPHTDVGPAVSVENWMESNDSPYVFESDIHNTIVPRVQPCSPPQHCTPQESYLDARASSQPPTYDAYSNADTFGARSSSHTLSMLTAEVASTVSHTPQPSALEDTFRLQGLEKPEYNAHNTEATQEPGHLGIPTCPRDSLLCTECNEVCKTLSQLKKHKDRHGRRYTCFYPECDRSIAGYGFGTKADVKRHIKTKHRNELPDGEAVCVFTCRQDMCESKPKESTRDDNYRQHLIRKHNFTKEEAHSETDRIKRSFETGATTAHTSRGYSNDVSQPIEARAVEARSVGIRNLESSHAYGWTQEPFREDHRPGESEEDFEEGQIDNIELPTPQPRTYYDTPIDTSLLLGGYMSADTTGGFSSAPNANWGMPAAQHSAGRSSSSGNPSIQNFYEASTTSHENDFQEITGSELASTGFFQADRYAGGDGPVYSQYGFGQPVISPPYHPSPNRAKSGMQMSVNARPRAKPTTRRAFHREVTDGSDATISSPLQSLESQENGNGDLPSDLLRLINDRGFDVVRKSNATSPNPSKAMSLSTSSRTTEGFESCAVCSELHDNPSKLKKHQKRHTRPYFCTGQSCNYVSGSKSDIKRHGSNKHWFFETWRCVLPIEPNGIHQCIFTTPHIVTFNKHLVEKHGIDRTDSEALKALSANCRKIKHDFQGKFWCGHCQEWLGLAGNAEDRWNGMFDHLEDHILGRNDVIKMTAEDWVPDPSAVPSLLRIVNGPSKPQAQTHAQVAGANSTPEQVPNVQQSFFSRQATNPSISRLRGLKRQATLSPLQAPDMKRSQSSSMTLPSRPRTPAQKTPPPQESSPGQIPARPRTRALVIYCCSCDHGIGNKSVDVSCPSCQHQFCDHCSPKGRRRSG